VKPRILVIRGGAIGDFILTLPAIQLLRENFPEAHLEIIGYKHIVALAEGRHYADATRSIEYGPMAAFFSPKAELSEELSAYFASFQQVVTYLYDPDGFFRGNLERAGVKNILSCYTRLDDSDHAARQLARPLEQMALFLEDAAARVYPSSEDRAAAAELLAAGESTPLVALHPGSGSASKNWPVEKWAELGRHMAGAASRPRLVLIGGEADHGRLEQLVEAWRGLPVLVARELPLPVLAAVLEKAALFIGHDSGISHLAAAVGTPCLLLFGPTDPDVWAPANAGVQVLRAPEGELAELGVEEVWAAVGGVMRL
jgi:heptosyltransferase-2